MLGAWLVKASGGAASTSAHVAGGFAGVEGWCVRPTYRTALVRTGQPVLLWVSGSEAETPAGIYARGWTTGPATLDTMPLSLEPLSPPLLRAELIGRPDLLTMEVLRMPAGSNPSFVTRDQLRVLRTLSPELMIDHS